MKTELKHSPPQITLDALAWLWMVQWRLFAAICGMERKNLVFYVLELSRVYTWLRQWSYTGLLREQSHVAAFSVRLFSPHSWEFRRLWLKTLTGSRSYKMQQTWQRLSISLTAFFYPLPASFQFCWVRQDATLSSRYLATAADGWNPLFPPTRSSKKKTVFPYCSLLKRYLKTSPAFQKLEWSCNTVLPSSRTGWVTDVDFRNHFQHGSNFILKSGRDQQHRNEWHINQSVP